MEKWTIEAYLRTGRIIVISDGTSGGTTIESELDIEARIRNAIRFKEKELFVNMLPFRPQKFLCLACSSR